MGIQEVLSPFPGFSGADVPFCTKNFHAIIGKMVSHFYCVQREKLFTHVR